MALPYSWTTINVGDKILYVDHITDLRNNADYLHNNAANRTYYSGNVPGGYITVWSVRCSDCNTQ